MIPTFEQVYNPQTHTFKIPAEVQGAALYRLFGLFIVATQIAQNPGLLVDIKGSARNVLDALAMRLDKTKLNCHPAVGTIARESGYASAGVSAALKKLESMGFITRAHRKHDTTVYTIGVATVIPVDDAPAENGKSSNYSARPAQKSSKGSTTANKPARDSHFSENDARKAHFSENADNQVNDDDSSQISKSLENVTHHHDSPRKVKNEPADAKIKTPDLSKSSLKKQETEPLPLSQEWSAARENYIRAGMNARITEQLIQLMRDNDRPPQYALDWLEVYKHRFAMGEVRSIGWLKTCVENNDEVPPLDSHPPVKVKQAEQKAAEKAPEGWDYMEPRYRHIIDNWQDPPGYTDEDGAAGDSDEENQAGD